MQLVIGEIKGNGIRIINDGKELPQGWKVLGEFIPLGTERHIGMKDVAGVEITDGSIVMHSGMSFDAIQKKVHPVKGGKIVGYFVPDGAKVMRGKTKEPEKT